MREFIHAINSTSDNQKQFVYHINMDDRKMNKRTRRESQPVYNAVDFINLR